MGITVESLPPIVKPPKNYTVKEIDGRSESIVEILGYKAYEKPILIGFNDTDISSVLDWLDGVGQLITSSEPDKYYDAYILDQIDYERAIRFRKANVPFLVQPYKYSSEEEETLSRIVINQGNTECLPLMTITGSGQVLLYINGVLACVNTINGYVTLDSKEQEAFKGTELQNRLMVGDFPKLSPGENTIAFGGTGTVTEVKTIVRSRWL